MLALRGVIFVSDSFLNRVSQFNPLKLDLDSILHSVSDVLGLKSVDIDLRKDVPTSSDAREVSTAKSAPEAAAPLGAVDELDVAASDAAAVCCSTLEDDGDSWTLY
jgi:hypothetical protein